MRILINGLVVARSGGHTTYFSNLIPHLGRLGKEHEFILLQSPWQEEVFRYSLPKNFTRMIVGPKKRSMPLRILWEQIYLPGIIRREKVDVLFAPTPATTLFSSCPLVIAVRNPNIYSTLEIRNWRYQLRNWLLRVVTQISVRRASGAIFVSNHSRDLAVKEMNVDPERTHVIHHGVGSHFFAESHQHLELVFSGKRPYVLTVSTIQTHKNYLNMIDAFARLCVRSDFDYDYVIAGRVGSSETFNLIRERIAKYSLVDRVHYLGVIPYDHLPGLYGGASLFVLPSFLETFGHTLVEAMASRVPIAASNASAIPEICGDAAAYFDPYDVDDIVRQIRRVLSDNEIRSQLVSAGSRQVQKYSWARTAMKMLDLFESIGKDSHGRLMNSSAKSLRS
jgi:glycosyltransferase involved in cell wall biosynthesis